MALGGLLVDRRRHGDRALGAARRRVLGRGGHLRAGEVEHHRGLPQRAADLPHEGRAGDPVVAVVVVAADATELVAGQLVGPLVVGGRLLLARPALQRRLAEEGHVVVGVPVLAYTHTERCAGYASLGFPSPLEV